MPASSWDLGNTIRSARIKKGYTQEYLAEILDITPSHLKMMEGGRRNPSVPLLFQMMELLMRQQGRFISTEQFMERIWGYESEAEVNVVWAYISYLRRKLEGLHSTVRITVSRGRGYTLEVGA